MARIEKVLIVGGGIGGLTLAAALGQRGVRSEVVELQPQHAVYGVGIIQPGNALRALRSLGLMDACLAAGFQTDFYRYYDGGGELLGVARLLRVADPGMPSINSLPRPSLHRILTDAATRAGATLRMGMSLTRLDQRPAGVDVTFTDGGQDNYDLVIGADGIRSRVRAMVFGEHPPQYSGHGCWRFSTVRPPNIDYCALFQGVGAKAGLIPLTDEVMYLLLVTNEPGNPRMPENRLHLLLRERLAQFGGTIAELRERISAPREVIYVPIEEVILEPPWHRGRVLLIGDAAHASSPHIAQGASMAIEDAVVLAELVSSGLAVDALLAAFMARRYERCKWVQDFSRMVGAEGQLSDPEECRKRNERTRALYADPRPRPHEEFLARPI